MQADRDSFLKMGLSFEEKSFYDILMMLRDKFDFEYDLAIYQKNNTTRFHRMILDDEYTLIKNGIPESTIDEILSSSVYPCDMHSEILNDFCY